MGAESSAPRPPSPPPPRPPSPPRRAVHVVDDEVLGRAEALGLPFHSFLSLRAQHEMLRHLEAEVLGLPFHSFSSLRAQHEMLRHLRAEALVRAEALGLPFHSFSSLRAQHEMLRHLDDEVLVEAEVLGTYLTSRSSLEFLPPNLAELRVVLLGNSWSERSSVGNFILKKSEFSTEEEPDRCLRARRQWREKAIVLINTSDLLDPNIPDHKLREFIKDCGSLSDPGPHVFLLVLQPEDFTEEHNLRLCRVLTLFSDQSFDRSLLLISTPREEKPGFMEQFRQHPPLKDMIATCHYRYLWRKGLESRELLTRLGQIVKENDGKHLDLSDR